MKLGYPVTNLGLGLTSSHTFRLAALTDERLFTAVQENLESLRRTLEWNVAHNLMFFRISSTLIPFASHANLTTNWQREFAEELGEIGSYIRHHGMRISMHPGQYVVLNSPNTGTVTSSIAELSYHAEVLDLFGLNSTHKIQIHLGGLHGDPEANTQVFIRRFNELDVAIRRRLVIENDERIASVADCVAISKETGIPVLLDTLHHKVKHNGEKLMTALDLAMATWGKDDGTPMIDYSSQNAEKKIGAHAITLDVDDFRRFLVSLKGRDLDIMLEIKNKEASALQAQVVLESLA